MLQIRQAPRPGHEGPRQEEGGLCGLETLQKEVALNLPTHLELPLKYCSPVFSGCPCVPQGVWHPFLPRLCGRQGETEGDVTTQQKMFARETTSLRMGKETLTHLPDLYNFTWNLFLELNLNLICPNPSAPPPLRTQIIPSSVKGTSFHLSRLPPGKS